MPETQPPSSQQVVDARESAYRASLLLNQKGAHDLNFSWREVNSATVLASHIGKLRRIEIKQLNNAIAAKASVPAFAGLWFNLSATVLPSESGFPVIHGKIGRLPVPPVLMRPILKLGRWWLNRHGAALPPLDTLIQRLSLTPNGVIARVEIPAGTSVIQHFGAAGMTAIESARVTRHYCRIAALQRADPSTDFLLQIRRTFAFKPDGQAVDDNRAALVALAMLTVSSRAGQLAGGRPALGSCAMGPQGFVLRKRTDLPQHWALSAALTAAFGDDVSQDMGTWKELADSGANGSGFSFVDLATDRSGIYAGRMAADSATADAARKRLSSITEAQLLPIGALALSEGLTEAQFIARYQTIESVDYQKTLAKIDQMLQAGR